MLFFIKISVKKCPLLEIVLYFECFHWEYTDFCFVKLLNGTLGACILLHMPHVMAYSTTAPEGIGGDSLHYKSFLHQHIDLIHHFSSQATCDMKQHLLVENNRYGKKTLTGENGFQHVQTWEPQSLFFLRVYQSSWQGPMVTVVS